MVSAGTVSSDSSSFEQSSKSYMSQIEGLSSSWQGSSHDNIVSEATNFDSEMSQVKSELNSFREAVSLYESYEEVKKQYKSYVAAYNNQVRLSENNSLINQYSSYINECEKKMKEYATQIQAALSQASSFKMESSSNSASMEVATQEADTQATSTNGGEFVTNKSKGVYGYIESSIDGKTHTVYNQSQIAGWQGDCNRAAAASIASGFASYSGEAVDVAKSSSNGIGYNSDVTNKYFSNFGLTATVNRVNGSYDSVKSDIVSNLNSGNYVMFDLSQPNVHGKSGQKWSSVRHWVSVLDIKRTGTGDNDYAIFVSDSGHGASTVDHGLGTGWYSLDEFSGQQIANFTTVRAV